MTTQGEVPVPASTQAEERPTALVDYIVVFVKDEQSQEARLYRRYPDDDILGSALPLAELLPFANDATNLDPAVSFTVCDTTVLTRRPRFKFFQDALVGLKSLVLSGDCVETQLEQLLYELPSSTDRVTKIIWEGVGELVVAAPTVRCGLPFVDDYSMNLLLDSLGAETLTLCIEALLREENLVFVSQRPHPLAPSIEALTALLHPFKWMGICVPLVPSDSIHRALSRRGSPFLYGLAQTNILDVKQLMSKHNDVRCFVVSLDDGTAEWIAGPGAGQVASSSTISTMALSTEHRTMIADRYRLSGIARIDGVRLAFIYALVDMLHQYKPFVNSWSTSSHSKREAGFDCEGFLSQTKLHYFDFLKVLLASRLFADFVNRVVNFQTYMSSTFDKLCRAWHQPELPHAARELLMRRYGYTERGARHVWIRVKHLHTDANLFSSKKFRDFVSELGLSKDGPPSMGDPLLDEIVDRQMRLEALVQRESERACPPLMLPTVARQFKKPSDAFPPVQLYVTTFNHRLSAWIPRRDDPIHFSRPSAKVTYLAFCRHPNDDELLNWKSLSLSRPRLHLAFAGGSSELKSALASKSSASISGSSNESSVPSATTIDTTSQILPKPIPSLTCAMKWAQLQGKRSLYDANQALFQLLMEERHRHREETRKLREKRSSSSSGMLSGSHVLQSISSSSETQHAGDPEMNHPRGGNSGAVEVSIQLQQPTNLLDARVRYLEDKLRERDQEIEILTRQLRQVEGFSGSVVRKSEPLFSSKHDRPASPGAVSLASNQSSSIFTSPVSTPRRSSSLDYVPVPSSLAQQYLNAGHISPSFPPAPPQTHTGNVSGNYTPQTPMTSSSFAMTPSTNGGNGGLGSPSATSPATSTQQPRVVSPPPYLGRPPPLRVISPPPVTPKSLARTDLKRSASANDFARNNMVSPTVSPHHYNMASPLPHRAISSSLISSPDNDHRRERNQRVLESIEMGMLRDSGLPEESSGGSKQ